MSIWHMQRYPGRACVEAAFSTEKDVLLQSASDATATRQEWRHNEGFLVECTFLM